jgi:hypothetical protein
VLVVGVVAAEMDPLDPSHEGDGGGAVGVVLDLLDDADGGGAPLDVDVPVEALGPSAAVEGGDAPGGVSPGGLGGALSQALQRPHLGPISDQQRPNGLTNHLLCLGRRQARRGRPGAEAGKAGAAEQGGARRHPLLEPRAAVRPGGGWLDAWKAATLAGIDYCSMPPAVLPLCACAEVGWRQMLGRCGPVLA